MQNNVAQSYWELAWMIGHHEVDVQFRYVFIMIGLNWCTSVKKAMIKEGLKRLLYGIERETRGRAIVGMIGITPNYENYRETKFSTVTYNRCLAESVRDCAHSGSRVGYLPLHLHFLDKDGEFLQPVKRYFANSEFTLAGGMVIREALLKALDIIPMDSNH